MKRTMQMISIASATALLLATVGCAKTVPELPVGEPANVTAAQPQPAGQSGQGDQILILCGSSFRPPMEKLVAMYKAESGQPVEMAFGGSEDHLPKVKLKAVGDVFVSHTPYQQYTKDAGALLREVQVGYLAPVLVTQKGNPKRLAKFEDLARPGLRVVLPDPNFSTCGEMVFGLLDTKYRAIKEAVLENTGNAQVRQHSEVASLISLDHRDAGIMWNGVAHTWLDKIDVVPIPYEYDHEIHVSVMGLSYTDKPEAVQQFLDFVEVHGKEVFAEFGYVK